jgi:ribosomal protein S18 acetylase RimI-like enzyme
MGTHDLLGAHRPGGLPFVGGHRRPAWESVRVRHVERRGDPWQSKEVAVVTPQDALRIRRATVADAAVLADFGARTFSEAFSADNRADDMVAYLARTYGVSQQAAELADPRTVTLLVEQTDGALAAYAQVRRGPAPACVTGREPVELWRFYVDRPWQGRGVAQRLMQEVYDTARALGGHTLWLGVWERNRRAIAFYARCGFVDVGTQEFVLGGDRQTDRVMAQASVQTR